MIKCPKIILACFVFIIITTFTPNQTNATVGGPTTINEFKYNRTDESIYYILNSYSGRGCPPMLYKLGLISEKNEVVYSCSEGEEFLQGNPQSSVYTQFNEITNGFKNLAPIHLKNNNIAIDVNYMGEGETNPVAESKKIEVVVYQNGNKIDEFQTTSCNLEQPFIFEGYEIPGFEKKIILLMSAKRNCNEGGYIGETIHVINNISNLDRTRRTNFYKTQNELAPDESSLIVFEPDTIKTDTIDKPGVGDLGADIDENVTENTGENENATEKETGNQTLLISIISVIFLLLGLFIGKLIYKRL
jgi:hypothetical protein